MKRTFALLLTLLLAFLISFCACGQKSDGFIYTDLTFPSFKADNPVRYLDENNFGKYNGWQDFSTAGEIRTISQPMGSTYTHQMYSYYIRNDLAALYSDVKLPAKLEKLPKWLAAVNEQGHRILWYSMGLELPERIQLNRTSTVSGVPESGVHPDDESGVHPDDGGSGMSMDRLFPEGRRRLQQLCGTCERRL